MGQFDNDKELIEKVKIWNDRDLPDVKQNKYNRTITNAEGEAIVVDVYDVLKAFSVTCPALQHLAKKALCCGLRGHKNLETDLQDIIDSSVRAKELNK